MSLAARRELRSVEFHWVHYARQEDFDRPVWGDDRVGEGVRNPIADAEMLLTLLTPTFQIESFSLRGINRVEDAGLQAALTQLSKGDAVGMPLKDCLLGRLLDFLEPPVHEAFSPGQPGGYARLVEGDDRPVDSLLDGDGKLRLRTVDGYTLTISVCVQAMCLLRAWIEHPEQAANGAMSSSSRETLAEVFDLCSARLTDAMLGLLRGFTVKTYARDTGPGAPGGRTSSREWEIKNGREWPGNRGFAQSSALQAIRRRLATRFGDWYEDLLKGDEIPFACGWSWGPIRDRPWIGDDQIDRLIEQHPVFDEGETPLWAVDAPYLYFTIAAIEGVADLLETKVRSANILNGDQAYLASQLGFLVDNTTAYWRALAFAPVQEPKSEQGRDDRTSPWYMERLPWRTTDGDRDDYYSLYVLGLILGDRNELDRVRLVRIVALLEELAQRARITREPYVFGNPEHGDPAVKIHFPGKRLELIYGSDTPDVDKLPVCEWTVDDFAPKLLKFTGIVGQRTQDAEVRRRALALADDIWDNNLCHRRLRYREADNPSQKGWVWDAPLEPFNRAWADDLEWEELEEEGSLGTQGLDDEGLAPRFSWHMTQRVSDALTAVVQAQERSTTAGDRTRALTQEIIETLRGRGDIGDSETRLSSAEAALLSSPALALSEALEAAQQVEVESSSNGYERG